jgi:hypothetical protein
MAQGANRPLADMHKLSHRILASLGSPKGREELITELVLTVQEETRVQAVGLRLPEGGDYPYYFTRGLSQDFVEKESSLCARDDKGKAVLGDDGAPVLECLCGRVISRTTDPALPFFTPGGSFWSNSTSQFLALNPHPTLAPRLRGWCMHEGYESLALIPLQAGARTFGLLQLNDKRKGVFQGHMISGLEGVGACIALTFAMHHAEGQPADQEQESAHVIAERRGLLKRIAGELQMESQLLRYDGALKHPEVIAKLDKVLDELEHLRGILPICSSCKKIRNDSGYWEHVEAYISQHSMAQFSHSMCPDCYTVWKEEAERDMEARGPTHRR